MASSSTQPDRELYDAFGTFRSKMLAGAPDGAARALRRRAARARESGAILVDGAADQTTATCIIEETRPGPT